MINSIIVSDLDKATNINFIKKNDINAIISVININYADVLDSFQYQCPFQTKKFYFDDTVDIKKLDAPTKTDVINIINEIKSLIESNRSVNLLVHCLAGISRSPAVALIAIRLNNPPEFSDDDCVDHLMTKSVKNICFPNSLIVGYADQFLSSNLVDAVERYLEKNLIKSLNS